MPITFTVTEDGELSQVTTEDCNTPAEEGQADGKKAAKRSHYQIARDVVDSYNHQLVYHAGEFYAFVSGQGWICVTSSLYGMAAKSLGTAPDRTVMPILQNKLSIPTNNAHETVYWIMENDDRFSPVWSPFRVSPDELVFSDCILDVTTNEDRDLPGVIYGPVLGINWRVDTAEPRCVEFEELIKHALPEVEVRRHFQEVMGTVLQPHVTLRGQIILWGEPYSGKTTIATAVGCCPGGRLGLSQMQEMEIVEDRFSGCNLVNKFLNVSDDSPQTTKWVWFMKRYTSGSMNVRPMYSKPISVTPTAKLLSTCNQIQNLLDASSACVDRMLVFKLDRCLPKKHGGANDEKMAATYWSHPDRRSGILTWLVEGLASLRTRGQFKVPDTVEGWKAEAEDEADQTVEILRNRLVLDPEGFVTAKDIISLLPTVTPSKTIGSYIRRLFPTVVRSTRRVDGKVTRIWEGVRLMEE